MTAAAVASPCNSVCRIDETSGWCAGCLRTIDEIAVWSALGDDAKRALCVELGRRRVIFRHALRDRRGAPRAGPEPE